MIPCWPPLKCGLSLACAPKNGKRTIWRGPCDAASRGGICVPLSNLALGGGFLALAAPPARRQRPERSNSIPIEAHSGASADPPPSPILGWARRGGERLLSIAPLPGCARSASNSAQPRGATAASARARRLRSPWPSSKPCWRPANTDWNGSVTALCSALALPTAGAVVASLLLRPARPAPVWAPERSSLELMRNIAKSKRRSSSDSSAWS